MASVAMPTPAKEDTISDLAVREPEENNRPRRTNLGKLPQKTSAADLYSEIKSSREEELLKTIDLQRHTIDTKNETIENLKKQNEELKNKLKEKLTDDDRSSKKRKRAETTNTGDEDEEKKMLQSHVKELSEKLSTQDKELHEVRELLSEQEHSKTENDKKDTDHLVQSMEKILTKKLQAIETRFSKIEDSLKGNQNQVSTYSDVLSKNIQPKLIENVIQVTKNSERVIESERQRRESNIIIYGAKLELGETDQSYLKEFFDVIGVSVTPKNITRIGKEDNGRPQPLKITLENIEHKNQIMSRLSNLKNAENKYRSTSVRDDYTYEERQLVKKFNEQARSMNTKENPTNFSYKVRGDPKNGLRIVRVTKVPLTVEPMEAVSNMVTA